MKRVPGRQRPVRHQPWVLGIDVGATNIRAGLVQVATGEVRCVYLARTEARRGSRHSLSRVALLASQAVSAGQAQGLEISKVGIGIPELIGNDGQIDSECSLGWRAADVHRILSRFGEVTLASDVRAAALAEARFGAGRGAPSFLYITVGTGIANTLVIGGEPYAGAHGHAISFASGPTFPASAKARKPRWEALEHRAAGPALLRRVRVLGGKEEDAVEVGRKARARGGLQRRVVDAAASELALHVAVIANALDPALIVMGGGLGSAPGRYWTTLRTAIRLHLWGPNARRLPVRRAALGAGSGLIGAALSAAEA